LAFALLLPRNLPFRYGRKAGKVTHMNDDTALSQSRQVPPHVVAAFEAVAGILVEDGVTGAPEMRLALGEALAILIDVDPPYVLERPTSGISAKEGIPLAKKALAEAAAQATTAEEYARMIRAAHALIDIE
jgi:hypothetical protein